MLFYRVTVNFENSGMEWWDNGGSILWNDLVHNKDLTEIEVTPDVFLDFFNKSEKIKGFYDGEGKKTTPYSWEDFTSYK